MSFSVRDDEPEEVTLVSSDLKEFVVLRKVMALSQEITDRIEAMGDNYKGKIELPEIGSTILHIVINYCEFQTSLPHLKNNASSPEDLKEVTDLISFYENEFIKSNNDLLFELIEVAATLKITPLSNVTCKAVAQMIKGKTISQIRTIYGIKDDFVPKQEGDKPENLWFVI